MDKLAALKERKREADLAYQEAVQARADRERAVRDLEAEREAVASDATATALLPGGSTAAEAARSRVAEIDEELERLRDAEEAAREAKEAATAALAAEAERLVPEAVEDVEAATRAEREALAALADVVLPAFEEVVAAREARSEARRDLDRLLAHRNGGGQEAARTRSRQRRALRSHLRDLRRDATEKEALGWLVARLLGWLRKPTSPVRDLLAERGIPPVDSASVLYARPIAPEEVHRLRDGTLPG